MTAARLVAAGIATAGDAVDSGVGETAGPTVDDAGDRGGGATGDAGAERIGVAAGDGAPDAVVTIMAKQMISARALKAWGYRSIGNGRIKSKSDGRTAPAARSRRNQTII